VAIATPESYADMLDRAKAGKYAIPAINVTSSQTLSAALKGFADAESDGIVQISNGGAAYWSGSSRLDRVKGSIAFAAYARAVGDLYPVTIGLHTDHCPKKLLADWIHPLLEIEAEQVKNGELPMFNSHMWDGSAEALDDNIEIAVDMLKRAKAANVVLEIEIGAVGGEEDGIKGEENANLYTTADHRLTLQEYTLSENPPPAPELAHELEQHIADKQPPPPLARRLPRERLKHFTTHTRVHIQPEGDHTTLELTCKDRHGLLSLISRILLAHGVHISHAKIGTYGEKVEDSFHLTEVLGDGIHPHGIGDNHALIAVFLPLVIESALHIPIKGSPIWERVFNGSFHAF